MALLGVPSLASSPETWACVQSLHPNSSSALTGCRQNLGQVHSLVQVTVPSLVKWGPGEMGTVRHWWWWWELPHLLWAAIHLATSSSSENAAWPETRDPRPAVPHRGFYPGESLRCAQECFLQHQLSWQKNWKQPGFQTRGGEHEKGAVWS